MKRRVVVTGLGAVTPIGNTVPEFWQGIREGRVGIGEITRFDTESFKVKLAAEVKDFDAAERMDPKAAKRMERFSQYAVAAAREAFADADLHLEEEDPFRAGVIVGSGIGSLETVESEYAKILKGNVKRVAPLMVPQNDFQYGRRQYLHPAGTAWKMHQCGDGLRFRNPLHRRRVPGYPVR